MCVVSAHGVPMPPTQSRQTLGVSDTDDRLTLQDQLGFDKIRFLTKG
jgi:hypothetical protein